MKMDQFALKLKNKYLVFAKRDWRLGDAELSFDEVCDAMALEVGIAPRIYRGGGASESSGEFLDRLWDGIEHYHVTKEAQTEKERWEAARKRPTTADTSSADTPSYGGDWS